MPLLSFLIDVLFLCVVCFHEGLTKSFVTVFVNRWDNTEIEKLSPWDMEPIPENGIYLLNNENVLSLYCFSFLYFIDAPNTEHTCILS